MSATEASPLELAYPRGQRLLVYIAFAFATGCASALIQGLLSGEEIDAGFFVFLAGFAFCLALWLICIIAVTSVTVTEEWIETSAVRGRIRQRMKWSDVKSAEHMQFPGARGSNKPPDGYYLNPRSETRKSILRSKRVGFTEDLVGYDVLEQFLVRKATEYSFPILPGS